MGRGRGRGRKQLTNGRTHEDKGSSGEEVVVPARKRRGRPQKRVAAEKIIEAEMKKLEAADDGDEDYVVGAGDGAKLKGSRTEPASPGAGGNKRNRVPKEEEDSNLDMENSSSTRSSNDESTRSNGFRQLGSRRKSTPRRAAEAGL